MFYSINTALFFSYWLNDWSFRQLGASLINVYPRKPLLDSLPSSHCNHVRGLQIEVTKRSPIGGKLPFLMQIGEHVAETAARGGGFQIEQRSIFGVLQSCTFISFIFFEFTCFYVISGESFYVFQSIRSFKAELSCRWLSAPHIKS